MDGLRLLLPVLDRLAAWPRARRWLGGAVNALPGSGRLPPAPRAFLGQRAFDLHEVDALRGELRLFGVREVMFTAEWLALLHAEIGDALGAGDKDRLLYRVAERGAEAEVRQGLATAGWMPERIARAIDEGALLDAARAEPDVARFFEHLVRELARLIISEGGWGRVESYAFREDPIRVVIAQSIEAKVCGPSERPTCALTAGGIAGQLAGLTGRRFTARETRCGAVTPGPCTFEVTPIEEVAGE